MKRERFCFDPNERIFTLSDVARLFRRSKKKLAWMSLAGALCAGFIALLSPVQYKAAATFKEGVEKANSDNGVRDLIAGFSGIGKFGVQPIAAVLMKSSKVLKPVIEQEGIQASVRRSSLPMRAMRRMLENLKTELHFSLEDVDWFRFQSVRYDGEQSILYPLIFDDPLHYRVLIAEEIEVQGQIGVPSQIGNISFTIASVPSKLRLGKKYELQFAPFIGVLRNFRKRLSIVSERTNQSVYNLSFLHRDRKAAARFLDRLMKEYREYLKRDHDEVASDQIAYLEKKQKQMYSDISQVLDEHAEYLKETIGKRGVIALDEEAASLLVPQEEILGKLRRIEAELAWFQKGDRSGLYFPNTDPNDQISQCAREIMRLEQNRDSIEIALLPEVGQNFWDQKTAEMESIQKQKESLQQILGSIPGSGSWQAPSQFEWAQAHRATDQKERFSDYLSNQIRLLEVREEILSERIFHPGAERTVFEGIDLSTARELYVGYTKKLDAIQASIRHLAYLKAEVLRPDFDLSSLSSVLHDTVSQQLVSRASSIGLQMKDERYRSDKEQGRWLEEIAIDRKILSEHLDQLLKVEELNATLMQEKIRSLQTANLDCINQNISLLKSQISQLSKQKIEALVKEKGLLEGQLASIRTQAADLPDRWKLEQWLELKSTLGTKIMTVLTEMVEAKTIGHHLHHVESKPLDNAVFPPSPETPRLFLFSFLGAFLFAFGSFAFSFFQTLVRGFPIFSEQLKAMGFPFSGTISSLCDGPVDTAPTGGDLDTLRRLALFADRGAKTAALLVGSGPDYSYSLMHAFSRTGKKALLIRCDFASRALFRPREGFLQWLRGEREDLPIQCGSGFDLLHSGGFDPYGFEALGAKRWTDALETLKSRYDLIFFWVKSSLDAAEAQILLKQADLAVVTVNGERTEELTPFADWAYHGENNRLTFVSTQ